MHVDKDIPSLEIHDNISLTTAAWYLMWNESVVWASWLSSSSSLTSCCRKSAHYCLSPDHDDGRHKARLFHALVGLNQENADLLVDALREAVASGDAAVGQVDRYGRRYVIDFEFTGPDGTAMIRSAGIVRNGEDIPRLVTCYIL